MYYGMVLKNTLSNIFRFYQESQSLISKVSAMKKKAYCQLNKILTAT